MSNSLTFTLKKLKIQWMRSTLFCLRKTSRKFSWKYLILSNTNNFMKRSNISVISKTKKIMKILSTRITNQRWSWQQLQNDNFWILALKITILSNVWNGDGLILNFSKNNKMQRLLKNRSNLSKNQRCKLRTNNLILKKKCPSFFHSSNNFKSMLSHWIQRLSSDCWKNQSMRHKNLKIKQRVLRKFTKQLKFIKVNSKILRPNLIATKINLRTKLASYLGD